MRRVIVATPKLRDEQPVAGALDGDAMRERLAQPDLAYQVVDVDPQRDVAEQLDALELDDPEMPTAFYASTALALAPDGELCLCLDPDDPETGDALQEIVLALRDVVTGPLLVVLEGRAEDVTNALEAVELAEAAKAALKDADRVELLVAIDRGQGDTQRLSPFTKALLEQLDEGGGAALSIYERIRDQPRVSGQVSCFAHTLVGGATSFPLGAEASDDEEDLADDAESSEADDEGYDDDEGYEEDDERDSDEDDEDSEEEDEDDAGQGADGPPLSGDRPTLETGVEPGQAPSSHAGAPASDAPVPSWRDPRRALTRRSSIPPRRLSQPPPSRPSVPPPLDSRPSRIPPGETPRMVGEYLLEGRAALARGEHERALGEAKKALGTGAALLHERAELYLLVGEAKRGQGKRREAIANLEKALQLAPENRSALDVLVDLTYEEGDFKSLAGIEQRVLDQIDDPDLLYQRHVAYAQRWTSAAENVQHAILLLERAKLLAPDQPTVYEQLIELYERSGATEEEMAARLALAELRPDAAAKAEGLRELGDRYRLQLGQEEQAVVLYERALTADPTQLSTLAILSEMLADRQEWSSLERVYRSVAEALVAEPGDEQLSTVRAEVSKRLGYLLRDHLEDPMHALEAFDEALAENPEDAVTRQVAIDLAREAGLLERAIDHVQQGLFEAPASPLVHQAFELFQRTKKPDQAFAAASVASFLGEADERERFVFEDSRLTTVPSPVRVARPEALGWLRDDEDDDPIRRIFEAISDAAVAAKTELLEAAGAQPDLAPEGEQDPEKSTVSAVRSIAWACHFMGMSCPRIHLADDDAIWIAAVADPDPVILVGPPVVRGRSLQQLAFLAGRHLAYHLPAHRLLLFYPSLDELSGCFVSAIRIAMPEVPIPPALVERVAALRPKLDAHLTAEAKAELKQAVHDFDERGGRADLSAWAHDIERFAGRLGYVMAGDFETAAKLIRELPESLLSREDQLKDLIGFAVSDAHYALRQELGISIEP